jgi:hypothetical protein
MPSYLAVWEEEVADVAVVVVEVEEEGEDVAEVVGEVAGADAEEVGPIFTKTRS